MANAPTNGKKGIDRFTNNGHGMNARPAISKKDAASINAQLAKKQEKKK